jgi:hypothetical protein
MDIWPHCFCDRRIEYDFGAPGSGTYLHLTFFCYFPSVNNVLRKRVGFTIPPVVKIILGIFITWFTLGISDLGDMID